jgi:phage tail sheath gpL-like
MGNANNMVPSSLRMAWKSTTTKITDAIAALDTDDCERVSLLGAPYSIASGSGTWEGEIAARYAAMRATQTHLGRSFNGLRFREVENPIAADNWTEAEKKTLIEGGSTPVAIPRGGDTLAIVRDVCCRTSYGVLDTNAMDCLDYIRNDFATALTAQERLSIVDEDADKPPVDFITDPGKIRGLLRSRADLLEQAGYMTNVATNWPNVVTNLSGSTLQLAIPVALIPALHNIMVRLDAAVPAGS